MSRPFEISRALKRYMRLVADATHVKELIELGPSMMKDYDGSEASERDWASLESNCRLAALWRFEITSRGYDASLVPWPSYLPDYATMLAEGGARRLAYEAKPAGESDEGRKMAEESGAS